MGKLVIRKYDKGIALIFGILTLAIILALTNTEFLSWAFARHQNLLSWYIRPLFLVPFCYFAYKKSWAGISITIFLLATSMFWFPAPEAIGTQEAQFLEMEMDYLTGEWGFAKIFMALMVPLSFILLGAAFWKRNLLMGLAVIVLIAVAKMIWGVVFGGESGTSIFAPALIGLLICAVLIYLGFKKPWQKEKSA
jgi:hypothetical protein